ncbi:MAG TPA: hypothetical protein PLY93_07680 [Turneriella sp.]|nr:hypothetical protein [Turneriella sp.]
MGKIQRTYVGISGTGKSEFFNGIINQFAGTEAANEIAMPDGIVRNIRFYKYDTTTCSFPITIVLRKNRVDTHVKIVIPAGEMIRPTSIAETVPYNAGDVLVWKASIATSCSCPHRVGVWAVYDY